jgi:hypothetical protein
LPATQTPTGRWHVRRCDLPIIAKKLGLTGV